MLKILNDPIKEPRATRESLFNRLTKRYISRSMAIFFEGSLEFGADVKSYSSTAPFLSDSNWFFAGIRLFIRRLLK